MDGVHEMIFRMHSDLEQFGFITRPTLSSFEAMGPSFDDKVIYAILREAIYCQGEASKWAAERVGRSLKEFDWISGSPSSFNSRDQPLYFSGGMIYPFMFDTYPELKKLKEVAQIIAHYRDWPDLYDEEQLAKNEVPVYVATFVDDAYIDFGLVQDTLEKIGNCKQFVTNTMVRTSALCFSPSRSYSGSLLCSLCLLPNFLRTVETRPFASDTVLIMKLLSPQCS